MDPQKKSFLDIAEIILAEENRPMSARELTALGISRGLLVSEGDTPWQTMKSKLSTDILNKGTESRFMRVFQGLFALRTFNHDEFVAQRFKKNKLDEDIAVIHRTDLTQLIPGVGYFQCGIDRQKIGRLAFSKRRREAEEDLSVIQLVSVFVVTHKGRLLTHLRSARLPEQRLHGEYSMMLGGHLSVEDFAQLTLDLFTESTLDDCTYILRELSEELLLETSPKISAKGYLYDESRQVSKQHLGLVYLVDIEEEKFKIGERGFLMNSQFETVEEINARIDNFENWSEVLLENIDTLIGKK
jgi:predicted NUDIX family phosphoesterase